MYKTMSQISNNNLNLTAKQNKYIADIVELFQNYSTEQKQPDSSRKQQRKNTPQQVSLHVSRHAVQRKTVLQKNTAI